MQLCKLKLAEGDIRPACIDGDLVRVINARNLSEVLHATDPAAVVRANVGPGSMVRKLADATLLAPVDRQEIWAAGVTYKRSQEARERESAGAGRFYDLVYTAARPELFFKAPAWRVVGPGGTVHIRRDSKWNVPEPELTLVVSPALKIVGYTIGNDMSSRDIEGENPLYLPQAKFYDGSCAIGPVITLADSLPSADQVTITLTVEWQGKTAFEGSTRLTSMARRLEELVEWLGRETSFPDGALLLTGTGIVPPDDFSLAVGDVVSIAITGIGKLTNTVGRRPAAG